MGPLAKASSAYIPLLLATLSGCVQHHEARVQTAALPPPNATPVQHTGRLWVELGDATWQKQCRAPAGKRLLCFGGVRSATFAALERTLWTSFPDVVLRSGEAPRPGDYVLSLDITIDAMPPDAEGPGWSAVAAGGFRLMRDGKVLHAERLGSRSRAAFAYGTPLGIGAGEVVDAFAVHLAQVLGAVPEDRPLRPVALPAVVSEVLTPATVPLPSQAPAALPDPSPAPLTPAPIDAPVATN
jgi:hypothetical protein